MAYAYGMAYEWRNWIETAQAELDQTRVALREGLFQMVAFFSHQIAEQSLKGLWLIRTNALPPHTHNLVQLCESLEVPDEVLSAARVLNPLYATARYPDVANGPPAQNYDAANAGEALAQAERVFAWCCQQLPR